MSTLLDTVKDVGRQLIGRAAAEQGGVISGDNPTHYNPSNPLRIWVIQLVIIIGFTQILSMVFSRIRQPRVIAEVIAGILLGPTVMGRIPHFSATIFPPESIPFLTLISTIGLVLFLFLVGVEVDTSLLKKNARASGTISAVGIVIPFGVGAAVAVPIYNAYVDTNAVSFGYFLLFIGVAVSITAFPVLCRILTELQLLDTDVGVIVLSAGVGNDVVGWILLALVVALVNASTGLTALWVLLASVGFTLFLLFPVKWAYVWFARWTGSLERGEPSTSVMTVTLLLVFISAFFTDIVGVHAIFGGFLAGLVIPKGGFAIAVVEKLEDLVTICFIPIYFVLSGLKTNLGLLDSGKTWGYVILVCAVSFFGKFVGCAATAKFCGFNLRESGAIGALMSCKGLVELIVLNIGLQAGILDTRLFSIFVIHAIVLTFITTPLTIWIYPPSVRTHVKHGHIDVVGEDKEAVAHPRADGPDGLKTRFTVVLHKMEYIPAIMTLVQYLQPPISAPAPRTLPSSADDEKDADKPLPSVSSDGTPRVSIEALRLIELSQRTSDVLRGTVADDLIQQDTVLSVFRTFGFLNRISVTSALSIVPTEEFSTVVATHARGAGSDLVIVPWAFGPSGSDVEVPSAGTAPVPHNPFESLFNKAHPTYDKASAVVYSHFIRRVFAESPTDVALFLDNTVSTLDGNGLHGQHVFLPFFGGPDDRSALEFVVQLCQHPNVTATIVRVTKTDLPTVDTNTTADPKDAAPALAVPAGNMTVMSASGFPDTLYPHQTTQARATSDMSDNIAWNRFASAAGDGITTRSPALRQALTRVKFDEIASPTPLAAVLERGNEEIASAKASSKTVLTVVGRARRLAVESHAVELRALLAEQHAQSVGGEVRKSLGEVACAVVVKNMKTGLLVIQAAARGIPE